MFAEVMPGQGLHPRGVFVVGWLHRRQVRQVRLADQTQQKAVVLQTQPEQWPFMLKGFVAHGPIVTLVCVTRVMGRPGAVVW